MAGVDGGWEGRGADVVVFGTCEIDMKNYSEELWKIWLARPADRKFNLICIVHNAGDFGWAEKYSGDWARVGALRILPISQHVVNAQRKNFINFADAPDRYHLGYSHIPVEAHIPILPIERFSGFTAHGKHTGQYIFSPGGDGFGELRTDVSEVEGGVLDRTWGRRDGKMLRDVCIQGNFEAARRNYVIIFADLEAELDLDPSAWGYLPPTSPSAPFIPADADNFILHLAGNGKDDFVPSRLKRVVLIHKALSYPDFFSLMGSMDMVLPAFKDGGGYYDRQASSTVAMAMQCETPLLVTPRILEAYSYLTPKTTVIRPQSISEVSALKILRTSRFAPPALGYTHDVERSYDDASGSTLQKEGGEVVEMHASVRREAEEMIARGWTTKERDWREFKKGIREKNREVAKRIVLDM
ncbi:hypothetical protein BDY24DRAFT_418552 [Mrakia frigida]|uniref:uncharacterized protein n=1 Tax=Mrakia frigida TaxID=29902 RepID=UPI003FCC17E2